MPNQVSSVLTYQTPFGLSAKKLAASLGIRPCRLQKVQNRDRIVVSWGAGSAPPSALNGQLNVSKLNQLRTWKEADLSTLTFSLRSREGWLPRSGTSFGGRDFLHPITSPSYWTQPVTNVQSEYRVHLCRLPGKKRGNPSGYRVIRLGYKVNQDPSLNRMNVVQIRSRQFGWTIKYFAQQNLRRNLSSELDLLSRWAIATLGWDFGALDVLHTDDGQWILLEVNSAPGLKDDKTCEAYATAIKEVLDAGSR